VVRHGGAEHPAVKRLVLATAAVLAATPAFAAHWNVDYAKSKLGFTVQWSNSPFVAVFKTWKADIDFDPADPAHAHVVTVIDIASEASDTPDNDDGLKGPEGFQTSRFPAATFEANGFTPQGPGKYIANGKLTIRGVTHPVALPFTLVITGNSAHMTGSTQVIRTQFGVGQGSEWSGNTPIAHNVAVNVDLTATKAP
jgi:polyisoprenoid-binding protein YceI